MAVAVAVRNARERQAPTKHRLEEMVASSSKALQEQKVLVLKVGACHLYAPRDTDLMSKDLKLKFRMHDITHFKAAGEKTITHRDEPHHVVFGNLGSTVYEGGKLEFDLCIPSRLWGKSTVVAQCKTSLEDALASFRRGGVNKADGMNLELVAVDTPGKVVANIVVDFGIELSTLRDAGGINALKISTVPPEPAAYSVFNLDEYNLTCRAYSTQAMQTQKNLQDVLMSASPSLSATTPVKGQWSQRRGSTSSSLSATTPVKGQCSQRRGSTSSGNSDQSQWSGQKSLDSERSQRSQRPLSSEKSQISSSPGLRRSFASRGQGKVSFLDVLEDASTASGSSSQTTSI